MQHERFLEKGEDHGKDHAHNAFAGKGFVGAAKRPAVTSATNILWLGEPAACDLSLVGGKTANLSLLAAKYPVPPGFCLTTEVFETTPSRVEVPEPRARELYGRVSETSRLSSDNATRNNSLGRLSEEEALGPSLSNKGWSPFSSQLAPSFAPISR